MRAVRPDHRNASDLFASSIHASTSCNSAAALDANFPVRFDELNVALNAFLDENCSFTLPRFMMAAEHFSGLRCERIFLALCERTARWAACSVHFVSVDLSLGFRLVFYKCSPRSASIDERALWHIAVMEVGR